MKRREFVILLGSLLAPSAPFAQAKSARIGVLTPIKRVGPALPAIAAFPGVDSGLMSYAVNGAKAFERVGDIAASILKGTNPGSIAVEQAAVFEFVVNLKVAKSLGVRILQSVLLRADRVIA